MRKPIWASSAVLLLVCLLNFIQCRDEGDGWKGTIKKENGITVVHNPAIPQYRESIVDFREEFIIPESDTPSHYRFVRPGNMASDKNGNLYVLDSRDNNVKVFDGSGHFLRIIGRQGVGPGELDGPVYINIVHDELAVYCSSSRRLTFFDLQGAYLRMIHATSMLGFHRFDSAGNVFSSTYTDRAGRGKYEIQKFDKDLKFVKTLASRDWVAPQFFQLGDPFQITGKDEIIYGHSEVYEINVYDDAGDLIKIISKDFSRERIPQEEKSVVTKKGVMPGVFDEIPDYYAPYHYFEVDEEGRIIVLQRYRLTGDRKSTFDVFDPEGRYLASFSLNPYKSSLWANKRLYAIEEDTEGLPIVRVRTVVWKH